MEDPSIISVKAVILISSVLVLLFSSAGAIRLSGSAEYAFPGSLFDLTCDVPEGATNVTFYRGSGLAVGNIKVIFQLCYFYNDTITTTCDVDVCACQPTTGNSTSETFRWLIRPTLQDHNSTWYCVAYDFRSGKSSQSPNYILRVAKGPDESVSLSPPERSYIKNENTVFPDITCTADCRPDCTFYWTRPDNTNFTPSSVLSLGVLHRSHQGSYTCNALNEINSTKQGIDIQVQYGPGGSVAISPPDSPYIGNEGTNLPDITCTADCNPACEYYWTRPGMGNFTNSAVLSLGVLQRSDQGQYVCTAWNVVGINKIEISVTVQYGPGGSIALNPPDISYTKTEKTVLPDITCTADCRPGCTFVWTRPDNTNFSASPELSLGVLQRSHQGRYICNAGNKVNSDKKEIDIIVQYPPNVPSVTFVQGNADVMENGTKSLLCEVQSNPSSTITWYFKANNSVLRTTSDVTKSTYTLTNAGCLDTGLYTCSAENSVSDSPSTRDIHINVLCPPRIDPRVNTSVKVGVSLSKNLILTASYLSNPGPSFTWKFHSGIFTEDLVAGSESVSIRNTYSTSNLSAVSTLTRSRMEERWLGIYIATIVNGHGSDTLVFTVAAADKPNPPYQGKADCPYIDKALLSWTSDFNGGSTQEFVVGVKSNHDDDYVINLDTRYEDPGRDQTIDVEVSDLLPGRLYFFNVIAINKYGNATLLEEVNCTTNATPMEAESNTAEIVAGVVVPVLIIAAVAVAVFVFRRKIFTFFNKKQDDVEMPSSATGQKDMYDSLDPNEISPPNMYDQVGYKAETPTPDSEIRISTYDQLSNTNPVIYEDLKGNNRQQETATVEGDDKSSKKLSTNYVNVKFPSTDEPTYVNAKAGQKKRRKKKKKMNPTKTEKI